MGFVRTEGLNIHIIPFADNHSSMTKVTTTRRIIQPQNYMAPNGIDEYAMPIKPGANDSIVSQGSNYQNGPRMSDSFSQG